MMNNIQKILTILRNHAGSNDCSYYIPEAWNCCGFEAYKAAEGRPGEIIVNPYAYMLHNIEKLLEPLKNGAKNPDNHDTLTSHIMFGMLPRMFTAWNHGNDGSLTPGSFLKVMCLIPYLKKMNISMIYLLPIFKHSDKYKKGSLGSPYAINNVYLLDEHLHDGLLGAYSVELLDTEFKAFVEACHISGIKVMVDFVFRTVARDNDLVQSHPDWFYWIDANVRDQFHIPPVENEKEHTMMSDKILPSLYNSSGIKDYLDSFRPAPNVTNAEKWSLVAAECKEAGGNILDYAEKHFGVTTVPGFPDVINDIQPPWTDVTYLRYYFDVHKKARRYVSEKQAPYILQDGAKLNLYRGDEKNTSLWEYIAGVIPHYQSQYGIDGARIDMGHALPPELNREIIARTRQQDPGFILWSEEFNVKNSWHAKKDGFNFITSTIWGLYKEITKPGFQKKLLKTLKISEVPVTGSLETPDTPRAAGRYTDKRLLKLLVWLNCFLPNSVAFVNNGQELVEVQPMNLGLDNTEEGRYMLGKNDPMYSRLAFFDDYALHWLNHDRQWMTDLLSRSTGLRQKFGSLICKRENFIFPFAVLDAAAKAADKKATGSNKGTRLISLFYYDRSTGENIFLLANSSMRMKKTVSPAELLPADVSLKASGFRVLCRDASDGTVNPAGKPDISARNADYGKTDFIGTLELLPGEVVIGQFIP